MTARRIFWRCATTTALVLGPVSFLPASAISPSATPSQPQQPRTTPELIKQAVADGSISQDQRLLYLAYAVYRQDRMPARFVSQVGWDGTTVVRELRAAYESRTNAKPAIASDQIRAEFNGIMEATQSTSFCDNTDEASVLESANYVVNYGTVSGGLTAQNYIDSLEGAFAVEITSYGWGKPPTAPANTYHKFPVQIQSLGAGLYGYVTNSGASYTASIGDNPNTPATETDAAAACMVLNNDFSGFPGTPQSALDATTAHEFVHAIQYGLGDPGNIEDDVWYEATATYAEDEAYDYTNDNYNYLWPSITNCLGQYTASPYAMWIFFRYAAEHNGGTNVVGGGENIYQSFWNRIAAGESGLSAYDAALQTKGTNLATTFHNYAIATRFSKPQTAGLYGFEEGAAYLSAGGAQSNNGSIATTGGSYNGMLKNHFAGNWIGLPSSGSYNVKLTNTSNGGQLRASIVADLGATLQVTALPQVATAGNQTTLSNYTVPSGATAVVLVVTNQEQTSADPASCTSNSYQVALSAATPMSTIFAPYISR